LLFASGSRGGKEERDDVSAKKEGESLFYLTLKGKGGSKGGELRGRDEKSQEHHTFTSRERKGPEKTPPWLKKKGENCRREKRSAVRQMLRRKCRDIRKKREFVLALHKKRKGAAKPSLARTVPGNRGEKKKKSSPNTPSASRATLKGKKERGKNVQGLPGSCRVGGKRTICANSCAFSEINEKEKNLLGPKKRGPAAHRLRNSSQERKRKRKGSLRRKKRAVPILATVKGVSRKKQH